MYCALDLFQPSTLWTLTLHYFTLHDRLHSALTLTLLHWDVTLYQPSSSSSAFPSYISGVHHFWVRFLRMWPFFNPTIKVVTFRLCGWCVLGVSLLQTFTHLGHESMRWKCMCAQTRPRFILSSERVLGGMEFEPMLTPRQKSPPPENFPRGGSSPRRCGQQAQTLPTSYSSLHFISANSFPCCCFLWQSVKSMMI